MKTKLMGILNCTPDSFSDGGLYMDNLTAAITHAEQMIKQGADIIDIGGESTRPGSDPVTPEEELRRVLPVIQELKRLFPNIQLSIDTYRAAIAKEALKAGCSIVNSLGGFLFDEKLAAVVADYECQVVLYHIKGQPKTMQDTPPIYTNVIDEIKTFFAEQIAIGEKHGIKSAQYILDPGIGFGKTIEHNLTILKHMKDFQTFKLPLLLGVSRKSHIGAVMTAELGIETSPTQRLEGSLAETAVAVQQGVNIIRTHDVLETKKFLAVFEQLQA